MDLRNILIRLHWLLSSQFGFNPVRFLRSVRGIPMFLRDWQRFRNDYSGKLTLMPCLHDRYGEGGTTTDEYFLQDLLVARWIHDAIPHRHVDVGSRVDGFVAHVASFREIDVLDVRPISSQIPGVTFKRADLMKPMDGMSGQYDSLSCLHALEHFGLGRYGDTIDPKGFEKGLANMASLLKINGVLYLSVPIGIARVAFNAHRVFDPQVIVNLALNNSLRLSAVTVIHDGDRISTPAPTKVELADLASQNYALGIFTFVKFA